jgi:hypothetical protein
MRRLLSFLLLVFLLPAGACSNEHSNPLDLSPDPDPNQPNPASAELTIDFSEFAGGDTITSTHGVIVTLAAKGKMCADALIAFDSSVPHGVSIDDDFDLGTPNQAFGGPGQGSGGADGLFRNNQSLGNLLVIQEDPALDDGNPDPQDDCVSGGTVVFEFGELGVTGVTISGVTVVDVDDRWQAQSQFRLYGEEDRLLAIFNPPVTRLNGVATMDFGDVSGVLRMEVEQRVSIAIGRLLLEVSDPPVETAG